METWPKTGCFRIRTIWNTEMRPKSSGLNSWILWNFHSGCSKVWRNTWTYSKNKAPSHLQHRNQKTKQTTAVTSINSSKLHWPLHTVQWLRSAMRWSANVTNRFSFRLKKCFFWVLILFFQACSMLSINIHKTRSGFKLKSYRWRCSSSDKWK